MFRWIRIGLLGVFVLLSVSWWGGIASAQELDFRQRYVRGKLLYQRKMYADAINELKKASYTARGRLYFGVYYYMALSYFWLPDIHLAHKSLQTAKRLGRRSSQKLAVRQLYARIEQLYGRITLVPQVDPDDVGRLRISLKPKIAFSNKHKQRYFRTLRNRLQKTGVVPNNRPFFVPKGDYDVEIMKPQCLKFGFFLGGRLVKELSVGDRTLQVQLKEGRSCSCTGGQKMYTSGKKVYCACRPGTGWNASKKRCEVGVNPIPWIIAGVGVVVAGTSAVIIGAVIAQNDGTDYRLLQNPNATKDSKTKVWK